MAFSSNKNKELLWNTLIEVGAFNNIKEDKLPIVKQNFDGLHKAISLNENPTNLLELNKQFTLQMAQYLNTQKHTPGITEVYRSPQLDNSVNKLEYKNSYDKKPPNKVTFKDEKDEPIKDIDNLLLKMQKDRNIELPTTQDVRKAEEWLKLSNTNQVIQTTPLETTGDSSESVATSMPTPAALPESSDTSMDASTSLFLNKLKKNNVPKQKSIEERLSIIEQQLSLINRKLNL